MASGKVGWLWMVTNYIWDGTYAWGTSEIKYINIHKNRIYYFKNKQKIEIEYVVLKTNKKILKIYRLNFKINLIKFNVLYISLHYETLQACASISVSILCNFPLPCLVNFVNHMVFCFFPLNT